MECYFCKNTSGEIDFKETALLRRFISGLAKIRARRRTGVCAKHQRKLAQAIKRARHMGLLPHAAR
ncbi:MAG: 30S ribosomal protein S18 [Candidatus Wildermuthbacteria bacterium RIFCSPHIGHO2_01_FULL_47_27]|uniref:Small ribosomal subunit protein bS18 n=2 Tax=Candidatus Wildermuthiibacteriota TaxID=1817923 RepID=A0A1G2RRQ8_9BACT|nr:MAG: 30S ribosomal protein S18 [Candidatus Wildermuthbacteria bacterium RIFCSPHIGHO2_01_FULL_47_27]OHA68923.1 MAG: 30S ribosomal protein S18 [Candidatus Wildermuthbacteria bacterium RIFCSPHIGHO2_02_FULL_47_17]OHA75498.1 MAG: 30S ribosomal protein S18 [Candidatus Wildermuthbacteria bacterium RIFCSPLOWO2_02_FULL_47_10]OHA75526.1 MAG: 30S ribosomal protein S18 [Candidatus Wildermuthbacteria bacterium RIFCSPLOWO2_01_FULL_48_35]